MRFSKELSVESAKKDLAGRLNIEAEDIDLVGVEEREFRDMSLGAPADGEMAAQMIASGWVITLDAKNRKYEYRGDKYQLRLHNFNGENYVIK